MQQSDSIHYVSSGALQSELEQLEHYACTHNNALILWFAPAYRVASQAYIQVRTKLHEQIKSANPFRLRIELMNGTEINFRLHP